MSENRNVNIFTAFPDNFFNVLTGTNRELMENSLSCLYAKTSFGLSYTLTYEDAYIAIEEMLARKEYDLDAGEEKISNDHDKAVFVLRRLRSCGWINDEIGENYQRFLHFEDYAVEFLHQVRKISSDDNEEYSGYIYTIYQLLKSIDPQNGDLALERASSNTEILFRQLTTLNTNIKKYIQNLLSSNSKDDLHVLMETLLDEYQVKVVDHAYYNLTTRDNPAKFKEYILNRVYEVQNDEILMENIIRQHMDRKAISYEESAEGIYSQLNYIDACFSTIDELIDEIDRKNHKYITSAMARITFLLEAHEDIEGKINRILKALLREAIDPISLFQLFRTTYFDEESLYTMKKKRLKVKQSFAEEVVMDDEPLIEFAKILEREKYFSRQNVDKHMLELLTDRETVCAKDLDLHDFESFTFLVLGYLYGHDEDSSIIIDDKEEMVTVNGYRFRDFTIRRKENG